MKQLLLFFSLLLVFTTASCSAHQALTEKNAGFRVQWYKGYTMPQFLAQAIEVKTQADLAGLLDKNWYDKFRVRSNEKAPIIDLSSCKDYFDVKQKPLWPVNESENSAFMQLVMMCLATRAISKAIPSHISTFKKLVFDKNLPKRLPAKMAMFTSTTEEQHILGNKAIKHMAQVYKIVKVKNHSRYDTSYFEEGQEQELQLVAKGDFNHDDVEDYLISSTESVQGGTYTALRLYLITRRPGQQDYTLLKEYKY